MGTHATALDPDNFRLFLSTIAHIDGDIMLEIKNKERSALAVVAMARELSLL